MTKANIVSLISEKCGLTKKDSEAALNAFTDIITEQLRSGEKVQIAGFGTFETVERGERVGRNPRTGDTVMIPKSRAPKFKAGKMLKDAVNI